MLRDTGRLLDRRNVPPITVHLPPFPRAVDLVLGRERVEGVDSLMKSAAKKEIEMCNPQEPWCIRTSEATYGGSPCSGPARICLVSAGGAPLEIIKRYIQDQGCGA